MTDLEKRARERMALDSGPGDRTWEESDDQEHHEYLMYAAEERAKAYELGRIMAYRTHEEGTGQDDIDWYCDLVLYAMQVVDNDHR